MSDQGGFCSTDREQLDDAAPDYPIRWVDFGQPRLQLIVPPYFDRLCREQGTTPQEVYDSGLGPPCDVITYQPPPELPVVVVSEYGLSPRPASYGRAEWLAEVRARIEAMGGRVLQ